MSPLLAILSNDHAGRNAGAVHGLLREPVLVAAYMEAARDALEATGATVVFVERGRLAARQTAANDAGRAWLHEHPAGLVVYVACHVNSFPASYGAIFHDAQSTLGAKVGEHVRGVLQEIPELSRAILRATPGQSWGNAYNTIKDIYSGPARMTGLCFEPYFIDEPSHRPLTTPEGCTHVGQALAAGLLSAAADLGVNDRRARVERASRGVAVLAPTRPTA